MRYFVGLGAQKAGTTWLHQQLALHPQVAVPHRRKELHYFDSVTTPRSEQNWRHHYINAIRSDLDRLERGEDAPLDWVERADGTLELLRVGYGSPQDYRDYLGAVTDDRTLVAGEISPEYATLGHDGFALIHETIAPKAIFIMRDPIDRYWSAIRMLLKGKDEANLKKDFARGLDRAGMWTRSDYTATIELADEHLDETLYLFYEDLTTADTLRRVARFLEVDEEWDWQLDRQANVGTKSTMPKPPKPVVERLRPVYAYVRERFGDEVPEAWRL